MALNYIINRSGQFKLIRLVYGGNIIVLVESVK